MTVRVAPKTILFTIFSLVSVMVIWQLRGLVLSLILSYILVCGFRPLVKRAQRAFRIGYKLASFLTFFIFFGLFIAFLAFFFGPFLAQLQLFINNFPAILSSLLSEIQKLGISVSSEQLKNSLTPLLEQSVQKFIDLTLNSISAFLFTVGVFVVTFYLLLEHDKSVDFLTSFFPDSAKKIKATEAEIARRIGGWVVGQIIIAILVGFTTLVGLLFLKVNYYLPLTLLATILSPIAGIGPLIALIPALVIASVQNPILGVWVFLYYNIIQTLKDNFVVPRVMSGVIGLNAFMILFVLLVGTTLFGFLGAIVSVPTAVGIGVIVEEIRKKD